MKISEKVMMQLVNKALEPYGVTMGEIYKNGGMAKDGKKSRWWWEVYTFNSPQSYEGWKQWAISEIMKRGLSEKDALEAFEEMDMALSPGCPYLFEKKKQGILL